MEVFEQISNATLPLTDRGIISIFVSLHRRLSVMQIAAEVAKKCGQNPTFDPQSGGGGSILRLTDFDLESKTEKVNFIGVGSIFGLTDLDSE